MPGRLVPSVAAAGTAAMLLLLDVPQVGAEPLHGRMLHAGMVGPHAAGIAIRATSAGAVIRDGARFPFLRRIPHAAVYDGIAIRGPHLLVEGIRFTGPLDVYASSPLVLLGSIVRPVAAAHWAVNMRPGAGPLLFLWSEAGGDIGDGALSRPAGRSVEIGLMLRADNATVYRSRVSYAVDGIRIGASHIRVLNSMVDRLVTGPGAHNDGIQILGVVRDLDIAGNRIVNPHPQTSAISILGHHVRVTGNWLAGGGWTVYGGASGHHGGFPPSTSVQVVGNVFGRSTFRKSGHFGVLADWRKQGGNVWSANTYETGERAGPPDWHSGAPRSGR